MTLSDNKNILMPGKNGVDALICLFLILKSDPLYSYGVHLKKKKKQDCWKL